MEQNPQKYHTVATVPKVIEQLYKEVISIPLTQIHVTLLAWYKHYNKKWRGLISFIGTTIKEIKIKEEKH